MLTKMNFFKRLFGLSALIFAATLMTARAQDSEKYREDYDRMQKIEKITQSDKRVDQILSFLKERSDMDAKIRDYVKGLLEADLRKMKVQRQFPALKVLCERIIKADPMLGQAYLYYGYALRYEKKDTEAMNAFAKGYLIKNPTTQQAKQELDALYKSAHRGSLAGEEKLISDVLKELGKLKK